MFSLFKDVLTEELEGRRTQERQKNLAPASSLPNCSQWPDLNRTKAESESPSEPPTWGTGTHVWKSCHAFPGTLAVGTLTGDQRGGAGPGTGFWDAERFFEGECGGDFQQGGEVDDRPG